MPTIRQKKLMKELVENGGKSVSKTMEKVGYSKAYAKNPQKITKTKTWTDLMDQEFPDTMLAERHRELLNTPLIRRRIIKGELIDEVEQLDTNAVKAGLDMAYKLKGKYAPEKLDLDPYKNKSTDELWKDIQRLRRELKIKD